MQQKKSRRRASQTASRLDEKGIGVEKDRSKPMHLDDASRRPAAAIDLIRSDEGTDEAAKQQDVFMSPG